MKKKIIRVMFFGALALTTFSYVGCKDYDDDIDRLEQNITENANASAKTCMSVFWIIFEIYQYGELLSVNEHRKLMIW